MLAEIERIGRRILMLLSPARITLSDDSGSAQVLQVRVDRNELIDRIPRIAEFGFTSRPPRDSDVVLVFVRGDRSQGIAIGTSHQPSRPRGLKEGESMVYSQDGKHIYFTADDGIEIEANGQPVTVNFASNVTINASGLVKVTAPGGIEFDTPQLNVTGEVLDRSGSGGRTMAQMRATYDQHTHGGVETGSGSTSTPSPTA